MPHRDLKKLKCWKLKAVLFVSSSKRLAYWLLIAYGTHYETIEILGLMP
jgi:hypothetical protein